jgi:hypothetical protein
MKEMGRTCGRRGNYEKILVTKPGGKRPVKRGGHRWKNNIKES